jgi:CRP-like cAMP-binding protein
MLPLQSIHNRLLAMLGQDALDVLAPSLCTVPLAERQIIERPGQTIRDIHFIENGVVSVLAMSPGDRHVQLGMIGIEGMTGFAAVLGAERSPNQVVVQSPGSALRASIEDVRCAMESSTALRQHLLFFVHLFMAQAGQTTLSIACAKLEERLARWILMAHDRFASDEMRVTHEQLALFLGVRRPAITVAIHFLEGERLIKSTRSLICVVDREGLRRHANGSYGLAEAEYAGMFSEV